MVFGSSKTHNLHNRKFEILYELSCTNCVENKHIAIRYATMNLWGNLKHYSCDAHSNRVIYVTIN